MKKIYLFLLALPTVFFCRADAPAEMPHTGLVFVENKGQITDQHYKPRPDIAFKLQGTGMNMFVGNGQIRYQWNTPASPVSGFSRAALVERLRDSGASVSAYRLDLTLEGANTRAVLTAGEKQG